MPSLAEGQARFAAALLEPARGDPGYGPGLAVYRANVWGNWADALAGAYPIVRRIVGEPFFGGLARAYALAHPSRSGDLNEYGAELAAFVAAFPHTADLPYLPDVARMEWLAHRAWSAADAPPFDARRLAGLALDESACATLALAPACALLRSDWPLGRLWLAHQDGADGAMAVDLAAGPDRVLIGREPITDRVYVASLAAGDDRFLEAARAGAALGEALEAAARTGEAFDAPGALARWVAAGVVVL